AKDEMFVHTDVDPARWHVVEAEDKKKARINMISHLLASIPYVHVDRPEIVFPDRPKSTGYRRTAKSLQRIVPDVASRLADDDHEGLYSDPEDA
ncbi:MAG: hypothetical protein Q4F65_07255, partial [Propionibacteriaceae bacterium]|nr:hypothetical protein [Propionibacteriaceae bacterium]